MRYLQNVALIVLLIVLPSCKFFNGKGLFGGKKRALVELRARQDSIRIADSVRIFQERMTAIEDAKIDSLRKIDEAKLAGKSNFNIIVGSFISPGYARDMAKVFRSKGYDARIITVADSRFELVSAEGHNSLEEAVTSLNAFHNAGLADAWIYIRK
jgi:hypothetical protein